MAHEKFARVILREIPVASIGRLIEGLGGTDPIANGNGCGNGCGAGCLDGFGMVFDRFNHSGLKLQELTKAQRDLNGLKTALRKEASSLIK